MADTYLFVLIYVANWMIFGLAFLVFINAMFDVGLRYVIYLAGSFSFASLIGMLSVFVPSGLGVREGILIFMLSQIMPVEVAIIISVSAPLVHCHRTCEHRSRVRRAASTSPGVGHLGFAGPGRG